MPSRKRRKPTPKLGAWDLRPEIDAVPALGTVRVVIPIRDPRLWTKCTNGSHGHPMANARRIKRQRALVKQVLDHIRPPSLPVTVLVTRISAGELDEHDNLPQSLKRVVDQVADWLGVPDNDRRITWSYAQEKCARGEHGVAIHWVGSRR